MPAAQEPHVLRLVELMPGGHVMHLVELVAATWFVLQEEQMVAPVVLENLPMPHV